METNELQNEIGPPPASIPFYRRHRFARIEWNLPVYPFLVQLEAAPRLWQGLVLPLRGCPDPDRTAQICSLQVQDLPAGEQLAPALQPIMQLLLQAIERDAGGVPLEANPLGRVLLVQIPPGASFGRELEQGRYAEHYERFVVALQADPGSSLTIDGEDCRPTAGVAWWINRKRPALVVNGSERDLVLLLVDVFAPAFTAARGLYIQREFAWEWRSEATALFQHHWDESAAYPDIPLEIDDEAYYALEKAGMLRCFTVRLDGQLVGYCIVIVQRARRYRSSLQAVGEDLYLDPDHRSGNLAALLLHHVEQELTKEGVQVFFPGATEHGRAGKFFEKHGYKLIGHVYGKRLD